MDQRRGCAARTSDDRRVRRALRIHDRHGARSGIMPSRPRRTSPSNEHVKNPAKSRLSPKEEDTMKRLAFSILAALCLAAFGLPAQAQDKYPSKPVKIIVPYAPGGATDIVARIIGEQMRQSLG